MQVKRQLRKKSSIASRQAPWFSTNELLEYLGISESELEKSSKLFSEGVHYRKEKPSQADSQTLWRIDLIDELLCLPVPPLEKEAMLKAMNNDITCN